MRYTEHSGSPASARSLDTSTPAYVLDLSPTGLGAVRALAKQGIKVRSFDSSPRREGLASRFGCPRICPDPVTDPGGLTDFLLGEASTESRKPFLLPCTDKFALFVSERRDRLGAFFTFVLPPKELFRALVSKDGTYRLALGAGVAVPRTVLVQPHERGEACIPDDFPFPGLMKPSITYTLHGVIGGKVVLLRDRSEALRALRYLPPALTLILQEVIPGEETRYLSYNSYRNRAGKILAEFVNRKVRRSPPGFGTVAMLESYRDDEFLHVAREMLDRLSYIGLANTEFKRDPRDGTLKLIEVNPRIWLCHPLSVRCGVDFVLTAYRDATGQDPVPQAQSDLTVRWQYLARDIGVAAFHLARGRGTLRELVPTLLGPRRLAVWDPQDPRPSLRLFRMSLGMFVRGFLAILGGVGRGARRGRAGDSLPRTSWTQIMDVLLPGDGTGR